MNHSTFSSVAVNREGMMCCVVAKDGLRSDLVLFASQQSQLLVADMCSVTRCSMIDAFRLLS
jgi:hypothetical protein